MRFWSQRHSYKTFQAGPSVFLFFFFNDTATTEIYTLSLHDALPISTTATARAPSWWSTAAPSRTGCSSPCRSEEHTSELQSRLHLVCRLLLEKKNTTAASAVPVAVLEQWFGTPVQTTHVMPDPSLIH